ncbi:MAG TPA: hypothetical protein VFC92_07295 [Bacteroidales bacterium]|nr:hypothetical protein [Bacteroidales bacterium]
MKKQIFLQSSKAVLTLYRSHFRKATLLFYSLFFLLLCQAQGQEYASDTQTWPVQGATWTYCVTGWDGMPAGEEIFGVTGDTLISGNLYSIISSNDKGSKASDEWGNRALFTRSENDTVYRYVNNQEYLFFTFNLSLGDVFTTFRTAGWNNHWEDSACSSILPLKVIDESIIEIEGEYLKKFILRDTLFEHLYVPGYPEYIEYTLIERIGIINNYPLINTMEPSPDGSGNGCGLPTDWIHVNVGHYSDNNFDHLFEKCEGVGINGNLSKAHGLSIFVKPNPAKEWAAFDYTLPVDATEATIVISNSMGSIVEILQVNGQQGQKLWDTRKVKPGVYYYTLNVKGFSQSGKIAISK